MYDRLAHPSPQLFNRIRPRRIRWELHYLYGQVSKFTDFLGMFTGPFLGCGFVKLFRLWQQCCHEIGMKMYGAIVLNKVDPLSLCSV